MTAAVVALGTTGLAQAATPCTGLGYGYHNGDVQISVSRNADGDFVLVDPKRGGLQVRNLANDYLQGWDQGRPSSDSDNVWGNGTKDDRQTADVDAYYAAAQTWDYFLKQHGRRGINDDGAGPRVFTDVGPADEGEPYGQYDSECGCMLLGSAAGDRAALGTLDVVAHEMTHGITDMTAGLVMHGEAGGLAESTSDIFGTLVEFSANNAKDRPDYTIGESVSGKPMRYMDDPTKDGVSLGCWTPGLGEKENHELAGISNKFFYQLAVGSGKSKWGDSPTCGGAPAVTGIGNDKAGKIWYRALTRYLVPNSNFSGARAATLSAAADLYGRQSTEAKTVAAAWLAVGVDGSDPIPAAPQTPTLKLISTQRSTVGAEIQLRLQAPDPQRQRVTFTATGLPPGLNLNKTTGVVTGRPTQQGTFAVTFTAADSDGNASHREMSWEVAPR